MIQVGKNGRVPSVAESSMPQRAFVLVLHPEDSASTQAPQRFPSLALFEVAQFVDLKSVRPYDTSVIVTRSVSEGLHEILVIWSLAYASGYDDRNCATSKLTLRVTIECAAFDRVQ